MLSRPQTSIQILDVAQELIQLRGFNAVSYSDISTRLGIRNASIHYHFPSKADLGLALVQRYRQRLETNLAAISAQHDAASAQLAAYLEVYRTVIHPDGRICLCTVLANDFHTLPAPMQAEVQAFFDHNLNWLTGVFGAGQSSGELRRLAAPREAAQALLAGLEGAMLLARSSENPERFDHIAAYLVSAAQAA